MSLLSKKKTDTRANVEKAIAALRAPEAEEDWDYHLRCACAMPVIARALRIRDYGGAINEALGLTHAQAESLFYGFFVYDGDEEAERAGALAVRPCHVAKALENLLAGKGELNPCVIAEAEKANALPV